jgi:hypothetical protein
MTQSSEVQKRIVALDGELKDAARQQSRYARRAYCSSQLLIGLSLSCSITAAICGIVFHVSPEIVGGIAALPPLVAFIASNLKLDLRENWYYRKTSVLETLRSRLLYQLPEVPTVDNVAAIAAARDKLEIEMQTEWYETITRAIFANMSKVAPTSRSTESSGVPSPVKQVPEAK